jgi:hypothetical protein
MVDDIKPNLGSISSHWLFPKSPQDKPLGPPPVPCLQDPKNCIPNGFPLKAAPINDIYIFFFNGLLWMENYGG